MKSKADEYIGKKIYRLTILEKVDIGKTRTHFRCLCECGNELIVSLNALQQGNTKSCGCLAIETRKQNGKRLSPMKYDVDTRKDDIYKLYCGMLRRCYWKDTEMHHKYYKNKGIEVCDEWKNNFTTFKKWALENNYQKGLAIDRIDSNGNYEPNNCRFITISENSKRVEHKKGVLCLNESQKKEIFSKKLSGYNLNDLATEYKVSISTIKKVLYKEMGYKNVKNAYVCNRE